MMAAKTLLLLAFLLPQDSAIDKVLEEYDRTVAKMQADFARLPADHTSKEWVKKKLAHMVEVDQYMRHFMMNPKGIPKEQRQAFMNKAGMRWMLVDAANTQDLKELLKTYTWFTISEFGAPADHNAWLLVQHADRDRAFQKEVLEILEALVPAKETNPKNYAYLFDRVAVAEGKPQRYATQGECKGPGKWEPFNMEDPENIDKRRASVGLGTLAEYKAKFKTICP